MKRTILSMLIGILVTVSAQARGDTNCEQVREVMRTKGIAYSIAVEVVDLFNASTKESKTIQFNLIPTVTSDCDANGSFTLGSDAIIRVGSTDLAALVAQSGLGSTSVAVMALGDFFFSASSGLVVHHAVLAALLQSIGFDTFESADPGTFVNLLPALGGDAGNQPVLLGTAGTNGHLFQVTRGQVAIALAH